MTEEEKYCTNANGLPYALQDNGSITFYDATTDTFTTYPPGTDPDSIDSIDLLTNDL